MTKLIQIKGGYRVERGISQVENFTCAERVEAVKILTGFGIDDIEIKDALASMKANGNNSAEFGINETFIRSFNTN